MERVRATGLKDWDLVAKANKSQPDAVREVVFIKARLLAVRKMFWRAQRNYIKEVLDSVRPVGLRIYPEGIAITLTSILLKRLQAGRQDWTRVWSEWAKRNSLMRWDSQFGGGEVLVRLKREGEDIWNKEVHTVLSALHSIVTKQQRQLFLYLFFLP